jgi:hypothetical protein
MMIQMPVRRRCSSAPSPTQKQTLSNTFTFKHPNLTTGEASPSQNNVFLFQENVSVVSEILQKLVNECSKITEDQDVQPQQQSEQIITQKALVSKALQKLIDIITHETLWTPSSGTTASTNTTTTNTTITSAPVTCSVCLASDVMCVYACDQETCEGALCLDCTKAFVQNTITNSKYAVPALRCPGRCFSNISTAVWRGVLRSGHEDEDGMDIYKDMEVELMQR